MCSEILIKNVTTLIGKNLQKILLNQCDSEKTVKRRSLRRIEKAGKQKGWGEIQEKRRGILKSIQNDSILVSFEAKCKFHT